jgi:hypothetical protein
MKAILLLLVFAAPASVVLADGSDDRYPDKRLSKSMELYQLETGAASPEVRAKLTAKDQEIAVNQDAMRRSEEKATQAAQERDQEREQHQTVMRNMQDEMAATLTEMSALLKKQKAEEGDPATLKERQREALLAQRRDGDSTYDPPLVGVVLHEYIFKKGSLEENFARILGDLDFKLVWRAPQFIVEQDFTVKSTDIFAALESVMHAYNERGISLEASVYSKNLIVEVNIGKWNQKLPVGRDVAGGAP